MKIDRRKNYYVVLDTETCPIDKDLQVVDPRNMWVYDIGWAIIDKKGNVYKTRSFLNTDIFLAEAELMKSAYYADKIPKYEREAKEGKRKFAHWETIRKVLAEDMKEFNTNIVVAHNARFDDISIKRTQVWLTKSKYRYFLPYGTIVWDSMKMALDTIAKQPSYIKWCEDNGKMTKHKKPRPQVKAETLYQYLTGNFDFKEEHTGLEDVLIEKEIFVACLRQHKPMRRALYG